MPIIHFNILIKYSLVIGIGIPNSNNTNNNNVYNLYSITVTKINYLDYLFIKRRLIVQFPHVFLLYTLYFTIILRYSTNVMRSCYVVDHYKS